MKEEKPEKNSELLKFNRRLDFYWQFTAVYAVVLLIYALFRGFLIDNSLYLAIIDPLSILFAAFIIFTLLAVIYQEIRKREIIISKDTIIFKSRFKEKKFTLNDILRISLTKDRRYRIKRGVRIIKFRMKGRRFPIRIRPSSYWNDDKLVYAVVELKKKMKEQHRQ